MSNQKDLKEEIRSEKAKFKELPFGEKIAYIKDYYWMPIVAVILGILLIYALIQTFIAKNYDTVLYVVLVNNDKSVWDDDIDRYENALSADYAAYIGVDNVKERVIVDNNYVLDWEKDAEMSIYSAESLTAMIYAGHFDVVFSDDPGMDYFCEDEYTYFYNLEEIFSAEYLEAHKDQIYYYTYKDGHSEPIAFLVKEEPKVAAAGLTIDPVYVGVISNSTRTEQAVDYIQFMMSEE
ncbi:MAG: hypothetical protein K6C69_04055 [Lachnospiraceae bacterium]|nr:hypothetical protein [Lachnospiraceae bacterium]